MTTRYGIPSTPRKRDAAADAACVWTVCRRTWQAKDEKELSVTAGDILHVVRSGPDSNWLLCRTAIGEGLVPANLGACVRSARTDARRGRPKLMLHVASWEGHMPAVAVDETPLEHPLHEAAKRGTHPWPGAGVDGLHC